LQDRELPPLNLAQRILLPVADAFMVAMLSRPPSGSLRTTRVTAVSIGLGTAAFIVFGVFGGVLLVRAGEQPLRWLAAVLLLAFALGSGALALYGLLQRRPAPR
jgi:uncharacterized membrane protein